MTVASEHGLDGTRPVPLERMSTVARTRLLWAAAQARERYPGPIGELLSQELLSWLAFGHLLGSTLIMRVADDLVGITSGQGADDVPRIAPAVVRG